MASDGWFKRNRELDPSRLFATSLRPRRARNNASVAGDPNRIPWRMIQAERFPMIELRSAILRIASIAAACSLLPATGGWGEVRETPSRFESYLVLGYSEVWAIAERNGEADLA